MGRSYTSGSILRTLFATFAHVTKVDLSACNHLILERRVHGRACSERLLNGWGEFPDMHQLFKSFSFMSCWNIEADELHILHIGFPKYVWEA